MLEHEFNALAAEGYNRIPLTLETFADLDTPLSIYLKLANEPYTYLLESVQGGERFGRYSFIGLSSPTRIEVVKWAEGAADFVEVIADLDPVRAMPVVVTQWNTEKGRREPKLWARPGGEQRLLVTIPSGQTLELPYERGPFHFWGFDLMGVAFMLPHLADPGAPFELTFVDPNRPGSGGAPVRTDRARFEPSGEESVGGIACRRYALGGPLFDGATGQVWICGRAGPVPRT